MSSFVPMVSASPPPMSPEIEDDDDHDDDVDEVLEEDEEDLTGLSNKLSTVEDIIRYDLLK